MKDGKYKIKSQAVSMSVKDQVIASKMVPCYTTLPLWRGAYPHKVGGMGQKQSHLIPTNHLTGHHSH